MCIYGNVSVQEWFRVSAQTGKAAFKQPTRRESIFNVSGSSVEAAGWHCDGDDL